MAAWQLFALYAVIGALVTWLSALLFGAGEDNDDVEPELLGIFWPVTLGLLVLMLPIVGFAKLAELGRYWHKRTSENTDA